MSNFFPTQDNIVNQNFAKIQREIKAGVAPVQAQVNRVSSTVNNIAGAISNYYTNSSYVNNTYNNQTNGYVNNVWNSASYYVVSPLANLNRKGEEELSAILSILEKIYGLMAEAFDQDVTWDDATELAGVDASLIRVALTRIHYVLEEATI